MAVDDRERTTSDDSARGDEEQRDESQQNGEDGGGASLAQELKQAVRDAALEVLGPAAREATTSAAKFAVKKGPDLVSKNVMPGLEKAGGAGGLAQQAMSKGGEMLSQSGGVGGMAGKLMSKLGGGGGGGEASGWGRNRRMPVQQTIYVSVPVKHAYNGWTEYKQWPRYMHRANQVDAQIDDQSARVKVTEKMWGFKRPFSAEIIEQRPDEHIKWNSTEGTKHTGVINFHELGPRLTLIELNIDHAPSGLMEKMARGARFVKRAVRADFHRFQGWIEMKSEDELAELEGWRGTIEGGQIVKSHEDALEEEQRDEDGDEREAEGRYDEDRGSEDEQREAEYDEEDPEAGEAEEPEAEYGDEEPEAAEGEDPEAEEEEPEAEYGDEEPEAEEDDEEQPEAEAQEEEEPQPRRRQPRPRRQPAAPSAKAQGATKQTGARRRGAAQKQTATESGASAPQRRRRAARQS